MHDIKFIKKNPKYFDDSLFNRNNEKVSILIIKIHDEYLEQVVLLQSLQEKRNAISKEIGILASKNNFSELESLKKEVLRIKKESGQVSINVEKKKSELNLILSKLPNMLDEKTPIGKSEVDNIILKKSGEVKKFNFKAKDHVALGEELGLIDYDQASKLSGSRFSVLKSELALLNRALINFMLDNHTKNNGYREVVVPELVKSDALFGTGQLPKFEEDLFKTNNDLWLIPTAEVCLTNLHRDEIINNDQLPLRYTSYTNCFRSEAGSAGKDTRGLIREHQFGKVELVSITNPNNSKKELERMVSCVEGLLIKLDLTYRIVELCSSDLGFSSSYTLDFEVWLPGQKKFREVSSCSNCKDFQSRRMLMRAKNSTNKETFYPHTLNGSGLAIGRIIVAIMENYQEEDGSIIIPSVLSSYMNGLTKISKL